MCVRGGDYYVLGYGPGAKNLVFLGRGAQRVEAWRRKGTRRRTGEVGYAKQLAGKPRQLISCLHSLIEPSTFSQRGWCVRQIGDRSAHRQLLLALTSASWSQEQTYPHTTEYFCNHFSERRNVSRLPATMHSEEKILSTKNTRGQRSGSYPESAGDRPTSSPSLGVQGRC